MGGEPFSEACAAERVGANPREAILVSRVVGCCGFRGAAEPAAPTQEQRDDLWHRGRDQGKVGIHELGPAAQLLLSFFRLFVELCGRHQSLLKDVLADWRRRIRISRSRQAGLKSAYAFQGRQHD